MIAQKNYGKNFLYLGTGKNVRKAVSILKKKFPDLNLADVNNPAQSESYPEIPQVGDTNFANNIIILFQDYNEPYNYNEYWPGSVNNNVSLKKDENIPLTFHLDTSS